MILAIDRGSFAVTVGESIDADGNRRAQRGQQDTALTGPKAQLTRSLLASRMISPSVTVQLQLFGAAQDLTLSAFSATVYVEVTGWCFCTKASERVYITDRTWFFVPTLG